MGQTSMDWWEQVEVLRDVVVGEVEFCWGDVSQVGQAWWEDWKIPTADANATVIRAMSVESLGKKYIV